MKIKVCALALTLAGCVTTSDNRPDGERNRLIPGLLSHRALGAYELPHSARSCGLGFHLRQPIV